MTVKEKYTGAFNCLCASDKLRQEVKGMFKAKKEKKRPSKYFTIAAAAALIVIISTAGVFAVNRLFSSEQTGKFQTTLSINKDSDNTSAKTNRSVDVFFGYLPENVDATDYMAKNVNSSAKSKLHFKNSDDIAVSYLLYDISGNDEIKLESNYVTYNEEREFGGNYGLYLEISRFDQSNAQNKSIDAGYPDKQAYIYFEDYNYLLLCYGGENLSKQEMFKILDNTKLTEIDGEPFANVTGWEEESVWSKIYDIASEYYYPEIKYNTSVRTAGKPFASVFYDENGEAELQVTVDSIQICDDFDVIKQDNENLRELKESWLDENGKIKDFTRTYFKENGGDNSLDEVVGEEQIGAKFVYETLTLKNNSDKALDKINIYQHIIQNESHNTVSDMLNGSDYFKDSEFAVDEEMAYYDFFSSDTNSPNYIDLAPGEEKTVYIGFMVSDKYLENSYICINEPDGQASVPAIAKEAGSQTAQAEEYSADIIKIK